ncbi:MAG: ABC transporter permease [Rhodospirillaceae bacterium]|nr:ABC transporter permease [Rhodospirillaceae bacterium]MYF87663.1 ABC transporter permease [Rhodospirillaceae bacterium]MYH35561.1 ABC transporter permease [Rhodospirillaceae bacterium]MYK15569.1 ABC transporter permease [Rhodospirillaceae bacterium]MYK58301.1 ABC transporter permease [Rhodospirillaceae bacterium]
MIRVGNLGPLYGILLFFILWQVGAAFVGTPLLFPEPLDVMRGIGDMTETGEIFVHLGATVQRLLVGLGVGIPVGAVIGCAMGASRDVNAWFDPYMRMANSIPAIALIPFALLWFGVTELARYSLVFYLAVYVVALSARQGVAQVPGLRIKAANTLGVLGVAAFFRVVIPSSFPAILVGIRTATGLGVMVVVAAEMLGAADGFGYLIIRGRQNYDPTLIFIGIFGLGILSILFDRGIALAIERFMPRWSAKRRV